MSVPVRKRKNSQNGTLIIAIILALISVGIVLFTVFANRDSGDSQSDDKPVVTADGCGNRANGSDAVSGENVIYFSRPQPGCDAGAICSFDKTTLEIKELCSSGGRYLMLDGDRVIFSEYSSGYLYSVSTAGERLTVLRSGHTADAILHGGYIYYCDRSSDSPHIGRLNSDGTSDTVLLEGWYDSLTIVGNNMYFADTDNGSVLCSMPLDGGVKTVELSIPVDDLQSFGSALYFLDMGSGSICSYKPGEKNAAVIYAGRAIDCLNVHGDTIYFYDAARAGIYSIGTDGAGEMLIAPCNAASITLASGYIFYIDAGSRTLWRVSVDGSGLVQA